MVAVRRMIKKFLIIRDLIQQGKVKSRVLDTILFNPAKKEKGKGKICLRYKGKEEEEGWEGVLQKIEWFDQTNAKIVLVWQKVHYSLLLLMNFTTTNLHHFDNNM